MQKKRIAITGGTGHLGNCLIQFLLSQDHTINALYTSNLPSFKHPNLTWLKGDITNEKAINSLLKKCDAIIHCAGIISIGDKNADEVYRVNVKGTETVVKECLKIPNIRLIHISSSNAVKETKKNEIFNENRPLKTKDDFTYGYTKAKAEKYVLNTVIENNLNAIVIRPTSIVGPPDEKPSLLGQTLLDLKNNKMPAITTGGYNLIDVRDLSNTIINGISNGEQGEVYLVGGEFVTVQKIAKVSNPEKNPIKISVDLLLFLMPLINIYKNLFLLKWPITKESIKTLKLAPRKMDFSKAIKDLNHKYRPAKESIEDLLIGIKTNNK